MAATNIKVSPEGMFTLALHEGLVPGPYRDSVGVWTYGIGAGATTGMPMLTGREAQ